MITDPLLKLSCILHMYFAVKSRVRLLAREIKDRNLRLNIKAGILSPLVRFHIFAMTLSSVSVNLFSIARQFENLNSPNTERDIFQMSIHFGSKGGGLIHDILN